VVKGLARSTMIAGGVAEVRLLWADGSTSLRVRSEDSEESPLVVVDAA